ncbi:MAG: 4Fe-4S dicluster domain-containing protein [Anaerolineales bacterium]|nr:4Fe-4S dicluster domain-containing protein [Anaerolineales bacterium]
MDDLERPHFAVSFVLDRGDFALLFEALQARGYTTIGPTPRDGVIVCDELSGVDDLPIGWTDEQERGSYRLHRRDDLALFGYTLGPHPWKRFLSPPVVRLWQAEQTGKGFKIIAEEQPAVQYALIGVRACDLYALHFQDRMHLDGPHIDTDYQRRRAAAFIVAVNCSQAGATCFCSSMGTGPKAGPGFDLALTEVLGAERHYFLVEVGSELGAAVLAALPHRLATEAEQAQANAVIAETATHMGRTLDTNGLKELLYRNYEHPHWEVVAEQCLTCGNCTQVCPTCFCYTIEDATDLTGQHAERWRKDDSCFTTSFSFISSGSIRTSAKARYRQWLIHKLVASSDQFGLSGCVGCGRCITWCPVGIDITAEAVALRSGGEYEHA